MLFWVSFGPPRCTSLQNPLVKHQLQLCPLHTSSTQLEGEGVSPQTSSSQNKSQSTGAFARRCQTLQQSGTCGQGISLPAFGSGSSGLSGPMLICWDCYHITGYFRVPHNRVLWYFRGSHPQVPAVPSRRGDIPPCSPLLSVSMKLTSGSSPFPSHCGEGRITSILQRLVYS